MLNLLIGAVVVGVTLLHWRSTMAALDNLRREVGEIRDIATSATATLNGIGQQLRDLINSGASEDELQAFADELDAAAAPLAAAIVANTPANGPVPVPPPVEPGTVVVTPGGTDEAGRVVSTPDNVTDVSNLRRT